MGNHILNHTQCTKCTTATCPTTLRLQPKRTSATLLTTLKPPTTKPNPMHLHHTPNIAQPHSSSTKAPSAPQPHAQLHSGSLPSGCNPMHLHHTTNHTQAITQVHLR